MTPRQKTALENLHYRFWSKVDFNGPIPALRPELGPCWLWKGALCKGYGRFFVGSRRHRPAHAFAHELLKYAIPKGLEPDHLCRNRSCINPNHLEVVTGAVNILRGTSPIANLARKKTCANGHPFDTTAIGSYGKRVRICRICRRARCQRWRKKKREAGQARLNAKQ
jgi:hypothetical protein